MFIISVLSAILCPMLEEVAFIKYILLVSALFYLSLGWFFSLLREDEGWLENEIVGFIYATVFFAGYLDSAHLPYAEYLIYFGILLATALMIFALVKKKYIRRDLLIQSIVLFLISPIPLWI
jgi:phosphate starvation-inducible membrane PsiE